LIREIPLYLLQLERSPFFGIETIDAEFHSLGKEPSKILLKIILRHLPAEGKFFF
jgi:hypothetical protein